MTTKDYKQLSSADPKTILKGLAEIDHILDQGVDREDKLLIFDAVTSLFYIDPFDRPELRAAIEKAMHTVAKMGPSVIPWIIDRVRHTDIKAELTFARSCGLMDETAIQPLIEVLQNEDQPEAKAFALYALGKIKSPAVRKALPVILKAVESPTRELEDTAVRALGKICESMRSEDLATGTREKIFEALIKKLNHSNAVIRAKALRSLGKLIRFGLANAVQTSQIVNSAKSLLGLDEDRQLDPAYLVRREAQGILDQMENTNA